MNRPHDLPTRLLHVTRYPVACNGMKNDIAKRVQKHRTTLRKAGLRPIQIWVPDTRKRGFAAECRRQSELVRNSPHEAEELAWLEHAADHEGWK